MNAGKFLKRNNGDCHGGVRSSAFIDRSAIFYRGDLMPMTLDHVIPGTLIFDGDLAQRGYALNRMCYSFNEAANREEFRRDEDAYCHKFHLTFRQRQAVKERNILAMIQEGGNIYYLAKLAGIFNMNVQDIGAQQTGMTVDEFKAMLAKH
jgi:protocatechuate 4,5-dioxygenase alpha chain